MGLVLVRNYEVSDIKNDIFEKYLASLDSAYVIASETAVSAIKINVEQLVTSMSPNCSYIERCFYS